jgi:hypothetical protein
MMHPAGSGRRAPESSAPGWLAFTLLFALSLPAVTTRLYASDEIQYFAYLRSIWFDWDLSFENEYRYFYDRDIARAHGFHETFLERTTETGRRLNFGTIGSALLWAPFYAVADISVLAARAFGSSLPRDGFSRPYIAALAYGSAIYGFAAVLLSLVMAKRLAGDGRIAAIAVWLGTPLLFYMYLAPGMAHACSAFAVTAFVAAWLVVRERWSPGGMAALGALAALMTMVREQDAFYAVGPAVDFMWDFAAPGTVHPRARSDRVKALLAGIAAFAVCFVPQAVSYAILNGRLGPATVVSDKMRWSAPHAAQVLFSPDHGFFAWTPLALLAAAGLVVLTFGRRIPSAGDTRRIGICLLAMFAAQVYISGSVDTWSVAGAYGQRRFVGASALLVVGLAVLLQRGSTWRRVLLGATAVAVWWNLGLMTQFGAGMMDRQRLDLPRAAYNTFLVVPVELPQLAYRYLFDRSSFYRTSAGPVVPGR